MFVNREKEIERLHQSLKRRKPQLIVVYGRRRCGKSTLLRHVLPQSAIYFSADLRDVSLQISAFAKQIDKVIPGFTKPAYPDWESLFVSLNTALKRPTALCIDEFPYLVKNSPELPSILQKIIDENTHSNYHLILCGSSQQMMNSMVLDSASPLYGRCDEILRIKPMSIFHMKDFLSISSKDAVEEYGVWGGVPRYWEIRKQSDNFEKAVRNNILDQNGILYEEPERLFSDEMRTSVQAFSILSLIGAGVHRLSEIAGRLGKPATQLSRMLGFLTKQKYIRREIPFGELARSTKKSLYKLDDPFLNFYFTFLLPNKSKLEFDQIDQVWEDIQRSYNQYISGVWEDICRKAIPFIEIEGKKFYPASRWWGNGTDEKQMEIDVVAESADKSTLLVGEVKWSKKPFLNELEASLNRKCSNLLFANNRDIIKVLFLKEKPKTLNPEIHVFTPDDIVNFSF
ncbi:MAG: ATP-binding protein [Bacteroidales bacterium]|nr:ATP-binding protein [Bacteroidales bacterium]